MLNNLESLRFIVPEIFLSSVIISMLVGSFFIERGLGRTKVFYLLGTFALVCTLGIELVLNSGSTIAAKDLFFGLLRFDPLTHFFKIICIISSIFFVIFAYLSRETTWKFPNVMEYMLLMLTLTLGMMFLCASANFVMLYLSLEYISFTSYLLTAYINRDDRTIEAATKYLIYGGVSSAVMVFGLSLLYGITGTLDFAAIYHYLQENNVSEIMLSISLILIFAGIGFKIAAFPFHFWCPDVYEGSPMPFAAFLSVGPKIAGFAFTLRFFFQMFVSSDSQGGLVYLGTDWSIPFAVISALTMTIGNLSALHQKNIKRFLAFSSIAHSGYILMAFASMNELGIAAVFFYSVVYLIMNLGAFLVAIIVSNEYNTESIEAYEGLGWKGPRGIFLASAFTIYLFSLTGIPPFAGFIGKIYLLLAVVKKGSMLYWLALTAVINTVISFYYYARIVWLMFFVRKVRRTMDAKFGMSRTLEYSVLGGLAFLTILLGIYWEPLDKIGRILASAMIR